MNERPDVYVMASGTTRGGGSGFHNLVRASRQEVRPMNYNVAGVVCNIRDGGVEALAKVLNIPFFHFPGTVKADGKRYFDAEDCYRLIGVDRPHIMMSGWLKLGTGYRPLETINIHPGSTRKDVGGRRPFAGTGMYGQHVHEAVLAAYHRGEIRHTEVTIHAVTDDPDGGAAIARFPVMIEPDDTVETLAKRVNVVEHLWQPLVLEAWLHNQAYTTWDGTEVTTSPFPH